MCCNLLIFLSGVLWLRKQASYQLNVGQRSLLLCVLNVSAAFALGEQLSEAAVARQCEAGSSAKISEYVPQGARDSRTLSGWEVSVLSALVPSVASPPWSLLPPPPSPSLALCVWTLLPVDLQLSGLSHATVSNHPTHPPLNPEPPSPSPTSSWPWEGERERERLLSLRDQPKRKWITSVKDNEGKKKKLWLIMIINS